MSALPFIFRQRPVPYDFLSRGRELYRRTVPHRGFEVLRRLAERAGFSFVVTSGTCVIECSAGKAIPTVRYTSERAAARLGAPRLRAA